MDYNLWYKTAMVKTWSNSWLGRFVQEEIYSTYIKKYTFVTEWQFFLNKFF